MDFWPFRFTFVCLNFNAGFVAVPYAIISKLIGRATSPSSWNSVLEMYALTVRFVMADGDWRRVRMLTKMYDMFERLKVRIFIAYLKVYTMGFQIEPVRRRIHNDIVNGIWIVANGDVLPEVGSSEWQNRVVCFWCHGGGFGAGEALSFASGHCEVINLYNRLDSSGRSLLYFSLEYPLAPGINSVLLRI